jgi:hypothetical protein
MSCIFFNQFILHKKDEKPPGPVLEERVYFGDAKNATPQGPVINEQIKVLTADTTIFTDEKEPPEVDYEDDRNSWVIFDPGAGNIIEMLFHNFAFESWSYSQYDRLGIQHSDDGQNWKNVEVPWMQTSKLTTPPYSSVFGGRSWKDSGNGWILPGTISKAQTLGSGSLPIGLNFEKRYVKFWWQSDGNANDSGWTITLTKQVYSGKPPEEEPKEEEPKEEPKEEPPMKM